MLILTDICKELLMDIKYDINLLNLINSFKK